MENKMTQIKIIIKNDLSHVDGHPIKIAYVYKDYDEPQKLYYPFSKTFKQIENDVMKRYKLTLNQLKAQSFSYECEYRK